MKKEFIRLTREEIIEKLIKNNKNKFNLREGFRGYENYKDWELIEEYQKEINNKSKVILYDVLISGIRPTTDDLKQLREDLMIKFDYKLNDKKTREKIVKYSSKWCVERRLGLRPMRCNEENNPPEIMDNDCLVLDLCEPVQPDRTHKFYVLVLGNNNYYIMKNFVQKDDKIIIVK